MVSSGRIGRSIKAIGTMEIETLSQIKVILWDIDGTLLNFEEAEKCAIHRCFEIFQMGDCTEEMLQRYSVINRRYWEALERGEMSKEEILVGRFREFFHQEGLDEQKAEAFNAEYQVRLGDTVCFCDNGYELVCKYKGKVKQYAVTNGTAIAQHRKLKNSGLDKVLDGAFISDELGVEKPNKVFFDIVLGAIGTFAKEEILIVGDSLTSDMQGGNNAGIQCCWYHPEKEKKPPQASALKIDYEIQNLWELEKIVSYI